ncbi:MAG: competence/damage-inducible protein A [Acidimicrobiales bacterium]
MRCEIVAVGTELLLGQIVDTNSSWIGEQLALAGIDSHFQTKVGDNADRIASALRIALDRSDAVIVCGGLGPTHDDITRDVIADVMGVELRTDPEIADRIRAMFGSRGRDMPDNNLRQAQVPVGAWTMDQQPGTAPGLVCPIGDPVNGQVIYAVPGVPYEMKEMVEGSVIPDLQRRAGVQAVIRSRTLRTWGYSESGLAELLAGRIDELDAMGHATIAFLASGMEGLKVRVTAKASTDDEAERVLADEVALIGEVLGEVVFSTDDESMEEVVLNLLRDRGLTLATAESVTGGLIASRLTSIPGASEVFRGSVVSYASEVKFDVLGVPVGPVVSDEAAIAMAEGACRVLGADVAVSVTGVAGPDPQEGVPVGTVYLGVCIDGEAESMMIRLPGDRERVRQFSTISVLDWLRRRLLAQSAPKPW